MKNLTIFAIILVATAAAWTYYHSKPTRIALISDIDHCTSRNPVSEDDLIHITSSAKQAHAQAFISLGDNISHRLGECTDTANADLPFVVRSLRTFGLNTFFVLGDHDIASKKASTNFWAKVTHTTINKGENYYSTDIGDVHVVVLDTILGGDDLATSCTDDAHCQKLKTQYEEKEAVNALNPSTLQAQEEYKEYKKQISLTRSSDKRDAGRIAAAQLAWLTQDLSQTESKKILILSDHPLFAFTSERKSYDIVGREAVQKILKQKNDKPDTKVVAISGEAHLWHHETREGIDYYILDEFKKDNAWALLSWGKEPFVQKVINNMQEPL